MPDSARIAWQPWSARTIERARRDGKPLLLRIGVEADVQRPTARRLREQLMRELAETIEFGHLVAIDADRHESRLDHRERGRVEVCAPLHSAAAAQP